MADPRRRLRVLRLIARMNVGGPALQAAALQGIDPSRFETRLCTGSVGADEGDYLALRAPGVATRQIAGLGRDPRLSGDVRAFAALVREMRAFRPDVVHTHTTKAGVLGRLAAWATGVPHTVHTFHGHVLHGYFPPTVASAVLQVERLLARRTSRLVAVGEQVRNELLAAGIGRPDQYTIVPPGVEMASPPPRESARARLGLPNDVPVVAYVGRLTGVKRPDRLAAVVARVALRVPDSHFLVVGAGEHADDLRARLAPLGERALMTGWRADVETAYAACDVVLLTSDNEGAPVTLIEAAVCGRAAVTTGVGSAGEVVLDGVTGRVTRTDEGALADAVVDLLEDRALRGRMGEAASTHATRFTSGRLISDVERLYDELVGSGRP